LLLGLRDFQDEKADIILKYTPDEARLLKSYGELADSVKINENEGEPEDYDQGISFAQLDVDVEFDIDDI
jgi:translation initiation factor 1A